MWDNYVHQKWLVMTRGLMTLFAGLILMANPDKAMRILMTILGFYFLLEAAILTILVLVEEQKDDAWWTFFCQGVVALMAGCLIAFFPQITLAGLIFVMASWILTVGICNLFISLQTGNAKFEGELILKFHALVLLLLSFLLFSHFQLSLTLSVGMMGLIILIHGIFTTALGFRLLRLFSFPRPKRLKKLS